MDTVFFVGVCLAKAPESVLKRAISSVFCFFERLAKLRQHLFLLVFVTLAQQ